MDLSLDKKMAEMVAEAVKNQFKEEETEKPQRITLPPEVARELVSRKRADSGIVNYAIACSLGFDMELEKGNETTVFNSAWKFLKEKGYDVHGYIDIEGIVVMSYYPPK